MFFIFSSIKKILVNIYSLITKSLNSGISWRFPHFVATVSKFKLQINYLYQLIIWENKFILLLEIWLQVPVVYGITSFFWIFEYPEFILTEVILFFLKEKVLSLKFLLKWKALEFCRGVIGWKLSTTLRSSKWSTFISALSRFYS